MATRPLPPSTRTITTREANAHFDTVIEAVASGVDEIILERNGAPQAAVISMEEYRHLLAVREEEQKKRRVEAQRQLRALMAEQAERNADLTEDEADDLAQRFSRELREDRYHEAQARLHDNHRQTASDSAG